MVQHQESTTAKLCAFARAFHSNRARKKIFDDYLAYDLMGRETYQTLEAFIREEFTGGEDISDFVNRYFAPIPLSRLPFTEHRLQEFARNQKIQYVICGAGADTFSFRNDNPDIEIFEIDHPDTQRYKLERIEELEWNIPENVHFVPVDFESERMTDKLLASGFDPNKKTFFSILGVSYYLTLPVFTHTLSQIAELSALGSVLVFDYPIKNQFIGRAGELEVMTEALGEKMQGGFHYNEVSRALYQLGFQIDTYLTPEKVQKLYFDNRTDDLRAFENVSLLSAIFTNGRIEDMT
ncbi:MAG: class I SAM-dependent methyltransferase [Oscillospiraceae bacterium]|nr:class I SAM-dependent methyltransferase [Oscillospiraceae bacterium]